MSIDVSTLKQIITQVVQETTVEDSAATPPAIELAMATPASGGTATTTATIAEKLILAEVGPAERGSNPKEVMVAVSPTFSILVHETITGLPHAVVLKEIVAGTEEEGLKHRFVRVYKTADVGFIAHQAAKLLDSGIGIGIQSRGTTVIHQKGLPPFNDMELFSQSPLIDLETFRVTGKDVAKYARGELPQLVSTRNDQMARPKHQAIVALLHSKETIQCDLAKKPQTLRVSTA